MMPAGAAVLLADTDVLIDYFEFDLEMDIRNDGRA